MEQLQKLKDWIIEQKTFNEQHRYKSANIFTRSKEEAIAEEQGIARNDAFVDVLKKIEAMVIAQEWLDKPQPKPTPHTFEVNHPDEIFQYAHGNHFVLYDINYDAYECINLLEFHHKANGAKLLCIKDDSNFKRIKKWSCTVR